MAIFPQTYSNMPIQAGLFLRVPFLALTMRNPLILRILSTLFR